MSKNSSPRSRPKRRTPLRAATPTAPRAKATPKAPETPVDKARRHLPCIAVSNTVIALAIALLCFALVLFTGSPLAYLPAAMGQSWFVAHGAPISFDGVTLGLVPLLPVVLVVALVARRVRAATRTRVSVLDLQVIFGLTLAAPLLLTVVAYFMVLDASTVYAVAPPHFVAAVFYPLVTHSVGFILGIMPVIWRAVAKRMNVPIAAVESAQTASRLFMHLCGGAAVVYLVLLAVGWQRLTHLISAYPTLPASGAVSLIVVSILYLPNAIFATLVALGGGQVNYANGAASLFSIDNIALPPLPLFGAIPGQVAPWAPLLMLVTAGIFIHFFLRNPRFTSNFASVVATAMWLVAITLLVAVYAGGEAGAYGRVGAHPLVAAGLMGLWSAGIAALMWAINRLRNPASSPAETDAEPVETEAEPAEAEAEPAEADAEPAEADAEPAEADAEPAEADVPETMAPERPLGGSTKWVPPASNGAAED